MAGTSKQIYVIRGAGGNAKDLQTLEEYVKAKLASVGIETEVLALGKDVTLDQLTPGTPLPPRPSADKAPAPGK